MTKASTFPTIPKLCSPQQRRYLRDRLSSVRSPTYRSWRDRDNEPKEVRDARKTIERWEIEQRKEESKRSSVYDKSAEAAKSAILFKGPDEALAAVEAHEKLCRDARP